MSDPKPSSELLKGIQDKNNSANLKHVETSKSVGSAHDMALVGVGNYDKTKLKRCNTEEKGVLPTVEDIQREKDENKN